MADFTLIKPRELDPAVTVYADDAIMTDDGVNVGKATPVQIVNAGAPVASEAEAIAGTDNTKRMTPLTTAQVLANTAAPAVVRAQAWAESATAPDPMLPSSKSSKTWAGEAAASAGAAAGSATVASNSATAAQSSATAAANTVASIVPETLVRVSAQTFTTAQKTQGRTNLATVGYEAQTLTAAQQDVAKANISAADRFPALGAVGSYAFCRLPGDQTLFAFGSTHAGSTIRPSVGAGAWSSVAGTSTVNEGGTGSFLTGTWVCLGEGYGRRTNSGFNDAWYSTLFQRIA